MSPMMKPSSPATVAIDPVVAAFDAARLGADALTDEEAEALDQQLGAADAPSPTRRPRSSAELAVEIAARALREE